MPQSTLIEKVIDQIIQDIEKGDQTALVELLNATPDVALESFLPEIE